jgi:outer membrane protein OmpA-like peptidoglycan-associated protein
MTAAFLGAILVSACAKHAPVPPPAPAPEQPKNVFVLLADPDNHVGRITVSNAAGSQELTQAGSATRVASASSAPTAPFQMDPQEVTQLFSDALAAQPLPPAVYTLYFLTNSTELTEESRKETLPKVIDAIRKRSPADISVVGHTDATGTAAVNDALSMDRAKEVVRQLKAAGVDVSTIEVTAHGKNNPAKPTPDGVAEPLNRRVEVSVR